MPEISTGEITDQGDLDDILVAEIDEAFGTNQTKTPVIPSKRGHS